MSFDSFMPSGGYSGSFMSGPTGSPNAGGEPIWNYLDPVIVPDGVTVSPTACWQYDGVTAGLTDRTGNAHNLVALAGTEYYQNIGGYKCLSLDESQQYAGPVGDAGLRLAGLLTIEWIGYLMEISANPDTIVNHGTAGSGAQAHNYLYYLAVLNNTGLLRYTSESGAGVASTVDFNAQMPVGALTMLTLTRDLTGLVSLYINGDFQDSGATTLPDGGASSRFYVTALSSAANPYHGFHHSMRMTAFCFTAVQASQSYLRVRGQY